MATTELPVLAIVVPCYNEEAILADTHRTLSGLRDRLKQEGQIGAGSYICYVDDGSRDRTWELISQLVQADAATQGMKLARNSGHQNALMAGMLDAADCADCVVTIDADLQDDVNCIERMVELYRQGCRIVYGVREDRSSDTFSKRWTAQLFYRLMSLMGVDTIYNHADFRLTDRQVLKELARFGEVNLFLRGIFPRLGFRSATVSYRRSERTAGETKFPFRKMLAFAWDGITSFTGFPLRMIFILGCIILVVSIGLAVWAFIPALRGESIRGWASTVIPIFLFAGLQMISIGVIGEYLAKVYQEVKARPRFIVETSIGPRVEPPSRS